jgi:hypothetical protein
MMQTKRRRAIREALATLASTHAMAVAQLEIAIRLLTEEMDADHEDPFIRGLPQLLRRPNELVDAGSQCVVWNGKTCFLGNNLLFRFFERISRSPNQYISYRVLLDDVWGGDREHSSIRGVAKRLRDRLAIQGMPDLSSKIDGTNPGHYRLMLV